jgi:hypothetical protein
MVTKIRIPIILKEKAEIDRFLEPVQTGIPFPKGEIRDVSELILKRENGEHLPSAATTLRTWSDGSLKWVLIESQISMSASEEMTLFVENDRSKDHRLSTPELQVDNRDREFVVRTGSTLFRIDKDIFRPFMSVKVDASALLDGQKCKVTLTDGDGAEWVPRIDYSGKEFSNSLRTVLLFKGHFSRHERKHGLHFIARLYFYAGHSTTRLDFTIWNPRAANHRGGLWDLGDPGSIFFKDLSFNFPLSSKETTEIQWQSQPTGSINSINSNNSTDSDETIDSTNIIIYQESSGGENWKSRNHVNHLGQIPLTFRGYRVYNDNRIIADGLRSTPIMSLLKGSHALSATLRHFWQNFPAALESKQSSLIISPFPGYFNDLFELQGGEQKTHRIYTNFTDKASNVGPLAWIHHPLLLRARPEWYCKSGVFYCVLAEEDIPSEPPYDECFHLTEVAVKGDHTFFDRRELIDEYGWRNFGDLYADHENQLYQGDKPVISHYNNQYDLINSFLIQHVRTGDDDWFRLAEELAWHVMDIDIYHTDQDRHEYNHGFFWHTDHFSDAATSSHRGFSRATLLEKGLDNYGGGPDPEHVYAQGLSVYYFLTGELQAKDAVLELAAFVTNVIDGPQRLTDLIRKMVKNNLIYLKTRLEPEILIPYRITEGPGRASGNGLGVLLDGFSLTGHDIYLSKAEYLIRQCIHPKDDIFKRHLNDVNVRWFYTVFLQSLGKYLEIKIELDDLDYMFYYARESLLHYAKWMLANEFPFLSKKELLDFPNFATRAATDIRKANVFLLASKYGDQPLQEQFIEKANFFFKTSMRDLLSLETRTLTRPLGILLQNMNIPLYFARHPQDKSELSQHSFAFRPPRNDRPLKKLLLDNLSLLQRMSRTPKLNKI